MENKINIVIKIKTEGETTTLFANNFEKGLELLMFERNWYKKLQLTKEQEDFILLREDE